MSRILDHIAELSPEKRALLALRNPLSFAQQRLWFLDRFEPGSPLYNVSLGLRLNGRLDRHALHRALLEISRRHEVLRTIFVEIDGRPAQIVDLQIELELPLVDLTSLSDAGREAELKRLNWEEGRQPLALASGNVLRAMLCRIKENDHAFLLTLHHIVSDAWSKDILIRELAELYQAFSTGRQSPLPDLPIQYADYAVWQREWLTGEKLERQLTYWMDRLADSPPLIGLHTDHPRSRVQTHSGATESRQLDDELSEALAAFGRERQATLFMVLLAALTVLLYRYTGQDDILVGTPVSTRGRVETEGLIGFFLNTLVLRNDLSGDPDFQTVLERVREVTLGAFANQDLPFEMLIDEMQPERSLTHTPLFQVMFVHKIVTEERRVAEEVEKSSDLSIGACEEDNQTAKFDLTFGAVESGDRLSLGVEYKTDLFERATILRMLDHCENLLRAVVFDPLRPISELPLLSLRERQQLLLAIDNRASHYPSTVCIHQLFEGRARAVPGNTALTYEGDQISYGELNERANQLAHYLRSLGVGSEVLVAVYMKRSADLVTALLGVLKAGGAYVPLDLAYPQERLSFMLTDAGVKVLITEQALLESLPEPGVKVVCVDSDWGKIARESGENLEAAVVGPDNLAYVIYTSGSTGKPKGVQISHRAVVNFLTSMRERPGLTDNDTLVAVTTLSFDIAGLELYLPLSVGARIVLVSRQEASDPTSLADRLTTSGATVMQATPATWRMLLAAGWHDGSRLKLLCGGEALPQELASELLGTGAELWNMYGPTETTIWSTVFHITKKDGHVLIGRPIANTQVYILDTHLQLVPIGVVGELFIGGEGLARGYLNRPELTAERFIPNPFGQAPGQRLYRTGDLAVLGPDGDLEYLGRRDFQTKVRGYRIELEEIEAALRLCEGVKDAVVIVREDQPGDQRIVAYCVMDEPPARVSELNRLLKEKLPIYMVPSFIVSVAQFPLNSSGKLNRKLLPPPDEHAFEPERISGPPSTPTQEIIAGIFAQVLKRESLGVKDNFFDLGGHSLLATRVVSRLRESLNIEIPLKALFENQTVAELADYVSSGEQSDLAADSPPIMRVSRDHLLPLSFAQERLWFLSQLDGANVAYNVPSILKLTGRLDEGALQRSLNRIVARHEVLRTCFVQQAGTPFQQVLSSLELQLPVIDLSQLESQQRREQSKRISTAEANRGFELSRAPLLRGLLIREAEQEHVLVVTMHHIISDAWSVGVMVRELGEIYRAEVEEREAKLEELEVQYGDYAEWQREWLRGEVLEREIGYWKEQLADAPHILDLPTDRPRPAIQTYRGARQSMALPRDLVAGLERLSRDEGVTLFMVLLASFDTLLYRYTSQQQILVGTPVANRNRIELEGLVGLFLNTLVMRGDLSGNPTFRELLRRVRQDTLGAYTHQLAPFELVIEALQPERSLSHSPLFQVMLALQEDVAADLTMSDIVASPLATEISTSKFDLLLSLVHGKKSLGVVLEYNSDMFDDSTIAQMLGHWARLLEAVAANSRQRLSELNMLTEAEYQQLIYDWNDTARDFDEKFVHEMFEQQASEAPEALALVFGEKSITYGELNRSANQLAHYLRKLGAGADYPVGICVERSELAAIAVLGILKAGAAYVPIDPAYPKERVAIILEDASIKILVSQTSVLDALPDHRASVIAMDRDWHSITSEAVGNPESRGVPDNLGYIIYTSGSTGRPKGIGLPHRALANLIQWQVEREIKGARTVQFASLSFDVSFQEMFSAWCSKGTVYIIPERLRADTPAFARYLNSNRIEKLTLPVVVLQNLAEEFAAKKSLPGSIKQITTTGEQLQITEAVKELFRRLEGCEFHNHYGPSETHVVTAYRMPHLVDNWPKYPPIGSPIANTQMYVLDKNLNPVPVGVYGELMIGGEMLARGYVNRADLTAEKFIPDPFRREAGSRLYRTGDLARYLRDGNIEFFGRIDHQVKIRGFRVELGEIEVLLEQHPEVRATVVLAQQYPNGEKRLVGYVVPHDKETLTTSELRKYLAEKLPDYMIPSAFVLLDSLPLSHNRKVDRRALPLPNAARPGLDTSYVAPSTPAEQVVAEIWSSLLGVERVGVHDNFFELGGHSLLATRLTHKIEEDFRVQIGLRALFHAPTVSGVVNSLVESWGAREIVDEIARTIMEVDQLDADQVRMASNKRDLIDRLLEAKGIKLPETHSIPKRRDGKPCPLSFAQERLWFVEQLNPGTPAYNLCRALCLTGRLEVGALKRSLNRIVARHEVLKTCFLQRAGSPFQQVLETLELELPVIDLSELTSEQRREQSKRISTAEANRGFELSRAPLWRALLIREAQEEHVLVVTMHHIISDGWSVGVMVRELGEIYTAEVEGREAKIEELEVQYGDYAEWQREWLRGEVLEREIGYWKEQLADAPHILNLPTDYPRGETLSARGSNQQFLLDDSFSEAIRALGSEEAATPFMVLMSAFQLLLYRYSGQDCFLIGADVAGRNHAQIEPLIGFFVNMLVTRADLSGDPTFRGLLRRVRDMAVAAYAHQDMPFDKIVEELQPARSLSYTPLFQVVFNFNSALDLNLSLELPGLQISPQPYDFDQVRFDLSLFVNAIGRRFIGSWRYRVDLFKPETIQRMNARFQTLLGEVVARPDARLSTFDLLHENEKREEAETKKQIRKSSFTKFKKAAPKPLTTEKRSLVTAGLLASGQVLPLVVRPAVEDVDLISWASENLAFIDESLPKHGAILFREFGLSSHAELERFARITSQGLIDYSEPSSPRTEVAQKIYTSTDYPASQWIELHNEMSYSHNWPAKIYFFCATAAEAGGETPIAFSQKVLSLLDPKIVSDFARKKVMYLRNYGEGLGLSWQHVFNTTDRSVVEAQCKRAGIQFEWRDHERLRTRQVHEALARHPKTAEELWFNQAHSFHVSALAPEVRQSLLSLFKEDDLPSNAFYGDGSRIEDSVIKEICHVYREAAVCFAWQKGDLLMVDNMLVAHGRAPFTGPRRILVAMAEKIEAGSLTQCASTL